MLDLLPTIPFVSLFIKFMVASTVLLGAVWLMEKVRLINTPDLAELAWKLAIAGSFIAVLPIGNLISSNIVIEDDRAAALIDDLNERRPLSNLAPERNQQDEPLTLTIDRSSSAALLDAKRAIEAAEARLGKNTETPLTPPTESDPVRTVLNSQIQSPGTTEFSLNTTLENNREAALIRESAESGTAPSLEELAAADTNNAQLLTPEYDSEQTTKNPIWYSAADLRPKDLAALGWVALVLLTVGTLMLGYREAVRNLGSRKRVEAESRPNQILRALCEEADIRHVPYLSRSGAIKSPVCLPGKEICLPDWAFDDMPEAEFKSLLAHELGHMVRRDPLMLMALQMLSRIFFFQPLFIIARKRLTDIAELAADEWAAEKAADSRAVANALFTCATKIHETRQIQWGLAMAGNKSILKQRVERLIHAQSVPFKSAGTFAKTALGVGVLGLSLGLPSIEFAGAMTAEREMAEAAHPHDDAPVVVAELPRTAGRAPMVLHVPSVSMPAPAPTPEVFAVASSAASLATAAAHPDRYFITGRDGNNGNISWSDDDRRVSLKWEGSFKISEDDSTILADGKRDGYVRIKTREDGETRRIEFEIEDGRVSHDYEVDGDEKELDADGRKWLKNSLRVMIEHGFGAEERVARLLKKGKAKAVFNEVKDFGSDYAKRRYLTELMDQAKLSNKEIGQVIDLTGKFDSDFEKRLTLSVLLQEEDVSDKVLPKVLGVVKGMDSDFEKRLLVTHYVSEMKMTDKSIDLVVDIAESIDSDFELRILLTSALHDKKLSDKNLERILDLATKEIDSDFEKRVLLTTFLDAYSDSDKAVSKALDATESIDSDFERRMLLSAIASQAEMNEENWLKAINVAKDLDSDFERRQTLVFFSHQTPEDNDKVDAAMKEALKDVDMDMADNGRLMFSDGSGTFVIGTDNDFDFEFEISEEVNEMMAELSEALAELESERAELVMEFREQDKGEIERRIFVERNRALKEQEREIKRHLRDQERVQREVERAEAHAVRQLEREIARVERELAQADKHLGRELSEVMRQLERSKEELQRQMERRRIHREQEKAEQKAQVKPDEK